MKKNDVIRNSEGRVFRVLELNGDRLFVVDCNKKMMPFWINTKDVADYEEYEIHALNAVTGQEVVSKMNQRFTIISEILSVVSNERERNVLIADVSERYNVSKQTLRSYLWKFLVYQDKRALAPVVKEVGEKQLSKDEKNIRWSLNKFYYTSHKCSLQYAYRMMLKEKYCDIDGKLMERYHHFISSGIFIARPENLRINISAGMGLSIINGI